MPIRKRTSKRRALSHAETLYSVFGFSSATWVQRGLTPEQAQEREAAWLAWKDSDDARSWLASSGIEGEPPPYADEALRDA